MNYYFAKSILLIIAATAATTLSADTSGAAKSVESFNDVLDDYAHDPVSASIDDEDRTIMILPSSSMMKTATTTR